MRIQQELILKLVRAVLDQPDTTTGAIQDDF
ncbi:MAG: hypothetical protein ACI9GW_003755 [Halieaceae bacterium]